MSPLTLACAVVVGLIVAYRFGYHHGVAYCMRQLKPLEDAAKSLSELARRR
jgi:hypothetical protein